jgi:hypothetical protein
MHSGLRVVAAITLFTGLALSGAKPVAAQQAVLYELVENVDLPELMATGVRVSYWTAQGTAQAGSPFCPAAALARLARKATGCTVTAFGMDSINLATLAGTVWANLASVVNCDNSMDAAEGVVMTGQMQGWSRCFRSAALRSSPNLASDDSSWGRQSR